MFRKLRDWWMAFVHVLGKVQTTILLSIVYHVAVGPISLISKLGRADVLDLKAKGQTSYAKKLPRVSSTLGEAEKQF
jgi:hypothetical protein